MNSAGCSFVSRRTGGRDEDRRDASSVCRPRCRTRGDTVGNGPAVLRAFDDAGVRLMLGGHLHRAYHVTMPAGRSACRPAPRAARGGAVNGTVTNWLTINGQAIDLEVRAFVDGQFKTVEQTSLAPAADRPRPREMPDRSVSVFATPHAAASRAASGTAWPRTIPPPGPRRRSRRSRRR